MAARCRAYVLNRYDREKRAREAAFLLEEIEAHILECQKP